MMIIDDAYRVRWLEYQEISDDLVEDLTDHSVATSASTRCVLLKLAWRVLHPIDFYYT